MFYTTEIFGSVFPCYCGNFPNKSSFPADFRVTSNFLPGRIIWVTSFLWVHPKGFYFSDAVIFCDRVSDPQSFESVLSLSFVGYFFSSLFFYPCEDKLNVLAVPLLPFPCKFSFSHLLNTQCELGPCMSPFWMIAAECGVCTLISWVSSWICSSVGPWVWGSRKCFSFGSGEFYYFS